MIKNSNQKGAKMNHLLKLRKLIFHMIIISTLVWACGPALTAPAADLPLSNTDQTTNPTPEPPVPEPENVALRLADFDGTVKEGKIGDIPVFVGDGTLKNDFGQILMIKVTGSSASSVVEYFNTALFYFEIRQPVDIPNPSRSVETEPNLSVEEIMKDEAAENLWIEFRLSEETAKDYPTGALLVIVDPTVVLNRYNNYASIDPASDTASVTIRVSQGQVQGKLYRGCVQKDSGFVSSGFYDTLSNSGTGRFDLTVKGINNDNNRYRVTGLWNYDYSQDLYDSISENVTC